MSAVRTDTTRAAEAIHKEDFSPESLRLISKAISEDDGIKIIQELIQLIKNSGLSEDETLDKIDSLLIALEPHDQLSALVLMLYLWPIVGDTYMHHIWDSIIIWVCSNMSDALRSHLQRIISREQDDDMRHAYADLMEAPNKHP